MRTRRNISLLVGGVAAASAGYALFNRFFYFPPNTPFKVGDIYESCNYHPVVLTRIEQDLSPTDWDLSGISLFDGTEGHSCSVKHCAPRRLSREQVRFRLDRRDRWSVADRVWRETQDPSLSHALLEEEFQAVGGDVA